MKLLVKSSLVRRLVPEAKRKRVRSQMLTANDDYAFLGLKAARLG